MVCRVTPEDPDPPQYQQARSTLLLPSTRVSSRSSPAATLQRTSRAGGSAVQMSEVLLLILLLASGLARAPGGQNSSLNGKLV